MTLNLVYPRQLCHRHHHLGMVTTRDHLLCMLLVDPDRCANYITLRWFGTHVPHRGGTRRVRATAYGHCYCARNDRHDDNCNSRHTDGLNPTSNTYQYTSPTEQPSMAPTSRPTSSIHFALVTAGYHCRYHHHLGANAALMNVMTCAELAKMNEQNAARCGDYIFHRHEGGNPPTRGRCYCVRSGDDCTNRVRSGSWTIYRVTAPLVASGVVQVAQHQYCASFHFLGRVAVNDIMACATVVQSEQGKCRTYFFYHARMGYCYCARLPPPLDNGDDCESKRNARGYTIYSTVSTVPTRRPTSFDSQVIKAVKLREGAYCTRYHNMGSTLRGTPFTTIMSCVAKVKRTNHCNRNNIFAFSNSDQFNKYCFCARANTQCTRSQQTIRRTFSIYKWVFDCASGGGSTQVTARAGFLNSGEYIDSDCDGGYSGGRNYHLCNNGTMQKITTCAPEVEKSSYCKDENPSSLSILRLPTVRKLDARKCGIEVIKKFECGSLFNYDPTDGSCGCVKIQYQCPQIGRLSRLWRNGTTSNIYSIPVGLGASCPRGTCDLGLTCQAGRCRAGSPCAGHASRNRTSNMRWTAQCSSGYGGGAEYYTCHGGSITGTPQLQPRITRITSCLKQLETDHYCRNSTMLRNVGPNNVLACKQQVLNDLDNDRRCSGDLINYSPTSGNCSCANRDPRPGSECSRTTRVGSATVLMIVRAGRLPRADINIYNIEDCPGQGFVGDTRHGICGNSYKRNDDGSPVRKLWRCDNNQWRLVAGSCICPRGYWGPDGLQVSGNLGYACQRCPTFTTTKGEGSTRISHCVECTHRSLEPNMLAVNTTLPDRGNGTRWQIISVNERHPELVSRPEWRNLDADRRVPNCGCPRGKTYTRLRDPISRQSMDRAWFTNGPWLPAQGGPPVYGCQSCPYDTYKGGGIYDGWFRPDVEGNNCTACRTYRVNSYTVTEECYDRKQCVCPREVGVSTYLYQCSKDFEAVTNETCGHNPRGQYCKPCNETYLKKIELMNPTCRVEDIGVAPGHWRASRTSSLIFMCPNEQQCLPTVGGKTVCAEGSFGPLCQTCNAGYAMLSRGCYRCKDGTAIARMVIGMSAITLLVATALYFVYRYTETWRETKRSDLEAKRMENLRRMSKGYRRQNTEMEGWEMEHLLDIVKRKFKILAGFYQIATAIPNYYKADFSHFSYNLATTINAFGIVNLDPREIAPIDCIQQITYYQYYLGKMSIVPALAIFIFVGSKCRPASRDIIYELGLLILFAIYPSLSGTCGETFRCMDDGNHNEWLKADFRVNCDSHFHQKFQMIDSLFMAVYPFGIPAFFFYLMWPHREAISTRPVETEMPEGCEYLSILCEEYEAPVYYWEIFECMRKYLTVSFAVAVFSKYASSQILFSIIVIIAYNSIFLYCAPYISPIDDILAYFCHLTLLFVFLIAAYARFITLLKYAQAGSDTLPEMFAFEMLLLIAGVFVIATVVFGVITTAWEFRELWENGSSKQGAYKNEDRVQLMERCSRTGRLVPGRYGNIIHSEKTQEYVVRYNVKLDDGDVEEVTGTQNMTPVVETVRKINLELSNVGEIEGEEASSSEPEVMVFDKVPGYPSSAAGTIELQARYTHAVDLDTGISNTRLSTVDAGYRASMRPGETDDFPDFPATDSNLRTPPQLHSKDSRHSMMISMDGPQSLSQKNLLDLGALDENSSGSRLTDC